VSGEIDSRAANEFLTNAVDAYIEQMGWKVEDMALTDVMAVFVRRGWAPDGGKTLINAVCVTDTSAIMALGMVKFAELKFDSIARQGFEAPADEED
jgi:hypothetical protein